MKIQTIGLGAFLTVAGFSLAGLSLAQAPATAAGDTPGAQEVQKPTPYQNNVRRGFPGPLTLADHQAVAEKRFARMDANGDGTITKDEFMALSNKRFERMDLNKDGAITPDERRAMRKKFGHKGGGWRHQQWRNGCMKQGMRGPGNRGGYGPGYMPQQMPGYGQGYMPGYMPSYMQAPMPAQP